MFVYGGRNDFNRQILNLRQISRVANCGLNRIGQLPFNLQAGACAVVNEKIIIICFDWFESHGRLCRFTYSPTGPFEQMKISNYHHYQIDVAVNNGKPKFFMKIKL